MLLGVQRVGEPRGGGAGLERLLLARMRRPAAEIDDLEGGADLAAWGAVVLAIDGFGAFERPARERRLAPRRQHVAAAHRPKLAHQRAGVGVVHRQRLAVGHGKCEARALQQRAVLPDIAEGGDMRACTALLLRLGLEQRVAKLPQ